MSRFTTIKDLIFWKFELWFRWVLGRIKSSEMSGRLQIYNSLDGFTVITTTVIRVQILSRDFVTGSVTNFFIANFSVADVRIRIFSILFQFRGEIFP